MLRCHTPIQDQILAADQRNINWGGSWREPRVLNNDERDLLQHVWYQVRSWDQLFSNHAPTDQHSVRTTVHPGVFSLYACNHEILQHAADILRWQDNSHFCSIKYPRSAESKQLLLDGFVVRTRAIKWQFRIVLRDGMYSEKTKQNLGTYIEHLDNTVQVSSGILNQLRPPGRWIWGGVIHTNDKNIATMISLIDPKLVLKIEELRSVDH